MNAVVDMKRLLPAWEHFRSITDIAPVRDEEHYQWLTQVLEALLQEADGNESHPAMELVTIVGDLIGDYEAKAKPLPYASGVEALKFLMEQHDLKQSDLPEVGSQGVVSEILSGKRKLNIRQVRALSQRFGVSPDTFL